jgi:hypothetical protein
MERRSEAVAGPMPLRGLVRRVRAWMVGVVVGAALVVVVVTMAENASRVVDVISVEGFWRIREGRKGRWGPWVLVENERKAVRDEMKGRGRGRGRVGKGE